MSEKTPRYDRELREMLDSSPDIRRTPLRAEEIPELREQFRSPGTEALRVGRDIDIRDNVILARDGAKLTATILAKRGSTHPRGALFHIHSGGMIAGDRLIGMDLMADWVEAEDVICASVDYRLAPEHPDPTPLNDCYDAFTSFAEETSAKFGDIPLVVVGMSAGGGLAAGLALLSRDLHGPQLSGQLLMCPMLDEANDTPSSHQFSELGLWDRESNETGWNALLGSRRHTDSVRQYASPSLAEDLSGLPPTYLDVGALEVFRSEVVDYAERLATSDVSVELHLWAGAFHGFDLTFPTARVSQLAISSRKMWLERLLEGSLS
jgi:acetyl esterase/lipase